MHFKLCIVCKALFSMHCIQIIFPHTSLYMVFVLCISFHLSCSKHLPLSILLCASCLNVFVLYTNFCLSHIINQSICFFPQMHLIPSMHLDICTVLLDMICLWYNAFFHFFVNILFQSKAFYPLHFFLQSIVSTGSTTGAPVFQWTIFSKQVT